MSDRLITILVVCFIGAVMTWADGSPVPFLAVLFICLCFPRGVDKIRKFLFD